MAGDDPFAVISTAAVDVIPRGAVLTHNNLMAANLQTIACMGLGESDCNLLALPLFHIAAMGAAFATMHAGGANVLTARFDAAQAARLIDAHNVTYLTSFPPVLGSILDAAEAAGSGLPSLKHVAGLEGPEVIGRLHAEHPGAVLDRLRPDRNQRLHYPAAGCRKARGGWKGRAVVPGETG